MSEAELYKIQSESEITDTTEKFKRILTTQVLGIRTKLLNSSRQHAVICRAEKKFTFFSLCTPSLLFELSVCYVNVRGVYNFPLSSVSFFHLPFGALTQLEEQRQSHSEELRRATLEAEARATELRVSIVAEKDKQFAAEKDALETRLRAAAAADLELATKRFEAKLGEGLEAQVKTSSFEIENKE